MRIARIAAVFALLVAGGGAFAEDLSSKLAELESGAKAPSDKVQIVPGVDQPQRTPATEPEAELEAEPEPEPAAAPEPESMTDPDADAEGLEPEDALSGQSLGGGTGLTVEPRVQNTTEP